MKTIYFDIGNVLCFFSPSKMLESLSQCCNISKEEAYDILLTSELQNQYERGKINIEEAHQIFQKRGAVKCTIKEFHHAISDIFTPNKEVWPLVQELKERGHRLILLSNTCESHFRWLIKHYSVLQLFDDQILSFEVGYMKPDPRIYQKALEKANCPLSNCFYTDDIPAYVEAAKKAGIDSEIFTNTSLLQNALKKRNYL